MVPLPFCTAPDICVGYVSRHGIVGSKGIHFFFLELLARIAILPSRNTGLRLPSWQQPSGVSVSPRIHQHGIFCLWLYFLFYF